MHRNITIQLKGILGRSGQTRVVKGIPSHMSGSSTGGKARVLQLRDENGQGMDLGQYEEVVHPVYFDIPRRLASGKQFKYVDGDVFLCTYPKSVFAFAFDFVESLGLSGLTKVESQTKLVLFGSFWSYVKAWQTVITERRHPNLHLVYYEDFVQNCFEELKKLQEFLDLRHDDVTLRHIERRCSYSGLQKALADGQMVTAVKDLAGHNILLRKGKIGDWKTHFTEDQSKAFDEHVQKTLWDCMFKFQYEESPPKHKL